jgi:hypothetical protein
MRSVGSDTVVVHPVSLPNLVEKMSTAPGLAETNALTGNLP